MFNDGDRPLYLEIHVRASDSNLLTGLETWLHLGLIDDLQVLRLSERYLSCPLSEINRVATTTPIETVPKISSPTTSVKSKPNIINQIWQAFLDELSIRWLLFLGIFLVVISSGVLAATQWNNFPTSGQYTILWLYTIAFWGIGFWSDRQNNLQLTARTLKNLATLLIPINFWAMSSLNLINSWRGLLFIGIATISLSCLSYLQAKSLNTNWWFLPLFLFLSYLHLGWGSSNFALIAVYIGITVIICIYYRSLLYQVDDSKIDRLFVILFAWLLLLVRAVFVNDYLVHASSAIALAAWLVATIYLNKEKSAINLNSENTEAAELQLTTSFSSKIFQVISLFILFLTWCNSLLIGLTNLESILWQTTVINGLTIHLFSQRLRLYWRKRDLTAIFGIGLQGLFIARELIPDAIRSRAIALAVEVSNTEYLPESVFSVTLFPYVILFVWISTWLYRREKPELALHGELVTLLLGIALTSLSLYNPTWRSLNLGLSALTLSYVAAIRQPIRVTLIYLAHCLCLLTVISTISLLPLNISHMAWGTIVLSMAVVEWLVVIWRSRPKLNRQYRRTWYDSCWYLGLLLAAISYSLFLAEIERNSALIISLWSLSWLAIPGMLTIVARTTSNIKQRKLAITLSCGALIASQILTIVNTSIGYGEVTSPSLSVNFETRAINLALATALMFVNAYYLRKTRVTAIHLGFALGFIASVLGEIITGWNWLIISAIAVIGLYRLRLYFLRRISASRLGYISERVARGILGVGAEINNSKLNYKYAQAADYWAIGIAAIAIIIVTLGYVDVIINNNTLLMSAGHGLIACILIGTAIYYRYRQQPQPLVFYILGWIVELAVFSSVTLVGGKGIAIATANIILGLITLWWIPQLNTISWGEPASLVRLPILYGLLGIIWRLPYFNTHTGLLTLGAAYIGINASSYGDRHNKTLNYFSITAISLGIYEIVVYQMTRSPGGNIADGFTILSLVAAAIAFTYRLTAWWWGKQQRESLLNLNLPTIILIAHLHWAISSILKIIAAGIAIETTTPRLTPISIAVSFLLGGYALIQGRDRQSQGQQDWWVYVGLVEISATIVYSRLIIEQLSIFDAWRVIFTCAIALIIYQIPWQNLGWRATPWQRTALVIPMLMTLVTAEDISYLSLLITALFYLRIAYYQRNIRWSYLSLGLINWCVIRIIWQFNTEAIWLAAILCLSILYIAQFDPDLRHNRQQRHNLRLIGSGILCLVASFYQDTGIIPSVISAIAILVGLGLRIRAFLFVGTIAFILTIIYQLVILVFTYSILKWIIGLLTGTVAIAVAANFESKRDRLADRIQSYVDLLRQWQ
jgi:hypothetical protein